MSETATSYRSRLEKAIPMADIRVLLMVLVHATGDLKWLAPPFQPQRDIRLIPEPGAGLPEDVQQQIRAAALEVLSRNEPAALNDPGDHLMQRMMSVCLGEDVALEYAKLNREEMGLASRQVHWSAGTESIAQTHHVLIVGAGVCGVALANSLKKLNVPFTVVDKNADVGGTWFGNRYPGCGVDTPNHSYSYSFGPTYRWPRYFSRREDVQAYVSQVVDACDLRDHIRFSTELKSATWNDEEKKWCAVLQTPQGIEKIQASVLVSAIGQLSDPSVPHIAGSEMFKGPLFHSSAWPDGLSLTGARVAVIGTGATAMQLVPEIADETESVDVFQRTAQWSRPIPGYSEKIPEDAQWLLENVPYYAQWFRFTMFWRYGDGLLKFLKKDPTWPHADRSINKVNDRHRQEMLDFLKSELGDRLDLIEKCTPTYPPYGKRILLDNGWYKTLKRPDVNLVVEPIRRIVAKGVETADGVVHEADVIVYSTGFKVTEMAARLGIQGRDGLKLSEAWANDNPSAYLGLTVPGFPNFFCMLGPGSGPGHGGSAVFQGECQARYITSCLVQMAEQRVDALEVKQDVLDEYLLRFDAEHESLIWTHPGMSTYYRNSNGRVFSVMPWRFVDYWAYTHDADLTEYRLSTSRQKSPLTQVL